MNRRMLTLLATLSTAMCLAPASLALAGEDDDPAPPPAAQPVPQPSPPPQPAAPAPAPAPASAPAPTPQPAPAPKTAPKAVRHQVRHTARPTHTVQRPAHTVTQTQPVARTIQVRTVPQAAVQAGGGAMAQRGPQAELLGLGAGLVLVSIAGGGLALRRRYEES